MQEKEIRFFGKNKDLMIYIAAAITLVVGLIVRRHLIGFQTRDWTEFWEPWMNEFNAKGFKAIAGDFYDYAPLFVYFVYFASLFGTKRLAMLKLVSVGFELIAALTSGSIVYHIKKSKTLALITASVVWMSPIVIANGSMWAQNDSLYTTFLLLAVLFLMKDDSRLGMIFFGIAFAFKLQALFWLPIIIMLWLFKRIKTLDLIYVPLMYLISIIPALIAGRPLGQLLMIYFGQTEQYNTRLSLKYPNIWYIIGELYLPEYYISAGKYFALAVILILMVAMVFKFMKEDLSPTMLLLACYVEGALALYFLPLMHERYGYFIEIIAIIIGVMYIKYFWVPVCQSLLIFICYSYYFNYDKPKIIPIYVLSVAMLFIVMFMTYRFFNWKEDK